MTGKRGGTRPGAGRPKGAFQQRSQQLLSGTKVLEGISPMEVLLDDMRFFYTLGQNKMTEASQTPPGKEQSKNFKAACALKDIARGCARDVAPYIHPKLASVQANVNVSNVEAELAELE